MAQDARRASIAARASWLCLLAAVFGGQLVFWQDSSDPFAPVEAFWFKVFLCLGALPLLGARWSAFLELCKSWPGKAALAWLAWLWISAFLTPPEFHADAFKTALEYNLYALPFFVGALSTPKERQALWAALLSGSLIAALYGFLQHFNADPWRWSTNFGGRPLGTIGNPNFFGGHLLLAWGLCLGALLLAKPPRRKLWAAALVLLFLVMLFTVTVGVWLGMAFSLVTAWAFAAFSGSAQVLPRWNFERGRFLKVSGALALALLVLCLLPPIRSRLVGFKEGKSNSLVNREMMWKVAIKLWKTAPVQGAGLCSYRPLYPKLQAEILAQEKGWNYVVTWLPHENYLYWLCETGLIGLTLFLAFWAVCLSRGWKRAAEGEPRAFAAILALAGLLGASFLNTFSNIPPTAVGSALCLGWLAWPPTAFEQEKHAATRRAPLEVWAVALLFAFLLGKAGGEELMANRLTRQGGRSFKAEDHAGAANFYGRAADMGIANFSSQSLIGPRFSQGEGLRQSGHLAEAIEAYKKDLVPNPWAPECHNMLGASLGQYGSMTRRGDLVLEAIDHLKTAAWLSPGYTTALVNLGGSYMTMGNLSGAAQAWTEVLSYEPANQEAQRYLQMIKGKH